MASNSKEKPTQTQQPLRNYLIDSVKLTEIMRYLMTRPYGEVVKIMNEISALNQLDPKVGADFVKKESATIDAKK